MACPILQRRSLCPVRRFLAGIPLGWGVGGGRPITTHPSLSSQIYFGDSLKLRSDDLRPFATLQTVSYPVSVLSPIEDGFCGWPKQLDSIELLDVQHDAIIKTCALLAAFFPSVRRLRLNSGTNGAHGPIPGEYRSAAELSVSTFLLPSSKQVSDNNDIQK